MKKSGINYLPLLFSLFLLAGFFCVDSAKADGYYGRGVLKSKNVLSGADVSSITDFRVTSSVPASTTVSISFSQDQSLYYSASGTKGAWTSCATGTTIIDLSGLNWSGALLFYKLKLETANASNTPAVSEVKVNYDGTEVPPAATSSYYGWGILLSDNLLSGASVSAISGFAATSSLPSGSAAKISFSQDKINFYSASGTKGAWDDLSEGGKNLDLSGLGWSGASLYYKLKLESMIDPAATPAVNDVRVIYSGTAVPPLSGIDYDYRGSLVSADLLTASATLGNTERFGYAISYLPYGATVQVQFSTDTVYWFASDGTPWGADTLSLGSYLSPSGSIALSALNWKGSETFYYKLLYALGADNHYSPVIKQAGLVKYSAFTTGSTGPGIAVQIGTSSEYCVPGDTTSCAAPVAEWRMDEKVSGDSKTIYDTSGSGNNGTTVDGVNNTGMDCSVPGKYGTGCEFDGVDDYVNAPSGTNLVAPYTVSLWFYPTILNDTQGLFSFNKTGGPFTILNSTNQIHLISDGSFRSFCNKTFAAADLYKWWHLNYVINSTTDASQWKCYINGTDNGLSYSVSSGTYYEPDNDWTIGTYYNNSWMFQGKIDNVRIYNYARTPAQIAWEYNKGKPVAEYRMNECQGSVIHDESGSGNHGTLDLGSGGQTSAGTCNASANTPWYNGRNGKYAASLNFDGEDDRVNIYPIPSLSDAYTFSMWIKTSDGTDNELAFGAQGEIGIFEWEIDGAGSNNGMKFRSNGDWTTETSGISDNRWHHVIYAIDGNSITAYVDGAQNVSDNLSYPGDINVFLIGGLDSTFSGQIDEVKIFNYALTAEQVKILYNNSSAVNFGN